MGEELRGFAERIQNIALFHPLFALNNNRKYNQYDSLAIGFGIMLLILENMLIGRNYCDHEDVARFLRRVAADAYDTALTENESFEMAYFFLDALRNSGRPFDLEYRDLETGGEIRCKFSLIEVANYEIHGKMRFRLTDAGLDLLFKTKEIYKELRISISQLYLRQQIEKGVFQEALRTVDDLYVQVRDVHSKLERIRQLVLRNVSGVSIANYISLMEEVAEQLRREKEVFSSLQVLLNDTVDTYRFRELTVKERESFDQLVVVSKRLDLVVNEHNRLFTSKLSLGSLLEDAMLDSLANSFRSKINFEHEFVNRVISDNPNLDSLRQVLNPLFKLKRNPTFNILRVLEPQMVKGEELDSEEVFVGPSEEDLAMAAERERLFKKQRDLRTLNYLHIVLSSLLDKTEQTLSSILKSLPGEIYVQLISEVEFYAFLVQLHQMGKIPLEVDEEMKAKIIDAETGNLPYLLLKYVDDHPETSVLGEVEIEATSVELSLENGSRVTDYRFYACPQGSDQGV
ncbi:hypothetical protein JCM15765_16700 [Paradesulfitobacterium aromaticivorans]